MAEENNPEAAETQDAGNKSKKKLLIIISIVSVLAILLSIGVTLFLLGGDEEPVAEEVVTNPSGKDPASYFDIKQPFLVTFNVDGRQRYMQVSISVVSRDASAFTTLEHHLPLILSRLNSTYSAADFNELKTEAGKLALQEKSLSVINEMLETEGAEKIENVYFTNFVLQ